MIGLEELCPARLHAGVLTPLFEVLYLPDHDLFTDLEAVVVAVLAGRPPSVAGSTLALFRLSGATAVLTDLRVAKPMELQPFLAAVADAAPAPGEDEGPLRSASLDEAGALRVWSRAPSVLRRAVELWNEFMMLGVLHPVEALTTPRFYGNKTRLTGFVTRVVAAAAPAGVPLLDLMAGTGVLARKFAERHPVWVNDANPYAALLSAVQLMAPPARPAAELINELRGPFTQNRARLQPLVGASLEAEGVFLHAEPNAERLIAYRAFADVDVLPITEGDPSVYRLALERYANVYFGVMQCVEIDSLRAAIDAVAPTPGTTRDFLLAALVIAMCACGNGPHFAQPLKLNSERAIRTALERRTRSVAWEFDLALKRLASRPAPVHPPLGFSREDWRAPLAQFAALCAGEGGIVYVDPPYSKLQYSRYYHVLNVVLAYDYPPVYGSGRYPPVESRFSSRFEYQSASARREFEAIIDMVANHELTLVVSYADRGFVSIPDLTEIMARRFGRVDAFAAKLRHHSQGRVLNKGPEVMERIFVGRSVAAER